MWDRPHVMNLLADLLIAGGAMLLVAAGAMFVARLPILPLREVTMKEAPAHVARGDIERALRPVLRGNLVSVDLGAVRAALDGLPWVRRSEVRRRWPDGLELAIEEHQPAARWGLGEGQMVNRQGEVFTADYVGDLPHLFGPAGSAAEVLRRYTEFAALLAPIGRGPKELMLTPRQAWQMKLDDGTSIELGREQNKVSLDGRLRRWVGVYPAFLAARQAKPQVVDLRYPSGFAVR